MSRKPLKDYHEMYAELATASDRAAGIIAASYLEDALLDNILDKLKISSGKVIEELVGNGAPLGTFSNKIMLAHAIGVIGNDTRSDCDRIRKIRNECAHDVNPISFLHNDRIKGLSAALTPRLWGQIPHEEPYLPTDPRARYIEACEKIAGNLAWTIPRDADDEGDTHPLLD